MITIVNRAWYPKNRTGIYCGRPGILGNPYTHIQTGQTLAKFIVPTREEAIKQYDKYFYQQLQNNDKFRQEIQRLIRLYKEHKQLTLICWCAPEPCHTQTIKEYILYEINKNLEFLE